MRIIFLDLDGVLVSRRSIVLRDRPHRHANADPEAVAALNYLIKQTGALLVVSSVWRIGETLVGLREIINGHFGVIGAVIGKTPVIRTKKLYKGTPGMIEIAAERGDEIDFWLRSDHREPVDSYVILDDDSDMGKHKHRLVLTQFETGLTMADAGRAIAMLNGAK
jgi:hypothetical protein